MERFKLGDIDNEKYYQIPKSLFSNQKYKGLGLDAKVIYAFLKDRMGLSRKNKWVDGNGDIFLLFRQDNIAELLDVSVSTVSRALTNLKKYELIDIERQGLGRPNKIYIRRILICTGDVSELAPETDQDLHPCHTNELDLNDPEISEPENKEIPPIIPQGGDADRKPMTSLSKKQEELFNQFWGIYPRKVGKGAVERAWNKIRPDPQLHEQILMAVYKAKRSNDWQKDNGRYIPNPLTWLNQRRWEDELDLPVNDFSANPQANMAKRAIEVIMNGQ